MVAYQDGYLDELDVSTTMPCSFEIITRKINSSNTATAQIYTGTHSWPNNSVNYK